MNIRIAAAALALAGALFGQTRPAPISGAGQILEGTWEFSGEQTAPAPVIGFRGLITFLPNGTCISTDEVALSGLAAAGTPAAAAVLTQTSGHGEWVRIGDRQFLVNLIKLTFNGRGELIGWAKLKNVLRINDDLRTISMTAGTFDFHGPNGRIAFSGRSQIQAQRIELEMP